MGYDAIRLLVCRPPHAAISALENDPLHTRSHSTEGNNTSTVRDVLDDVAASALGEDGIAPVTFIFRFEGNGYVAFSWNENMPDASPDDWSVRDGDVFRWTISGAADRYMSLRRAGSVGELIAKFYPADILHDLPLGVG